MDTDTNTKTSGTRTILQPAHLWWAGFVVFCLGMSALAVFLVPPVFVIGLVFVLASVVVIVRYPFIGLLLYLATFLMRPGELYPALDPLSIERLIGILVLIATLVRNKYAHGTFKFPVDISSKLLFGFFGLICASWAISYSPGDTQKSIEEFLKLVVFYLIIFYEVDTKAKFDVFLSAFVLLIGMIAFLSFRDYYGGGAIYRMGISRAIGRTSAGGDANTLAGTLATTVPLIVAAYRVYRHALVRIACIGLLGLLLLMIVNTGSRSGLLTLLAVIATIVWFSRYRMITAVAAVVLMIAGWLVLPEQYKARYETIIDDNRDADAISSGRVHIWKNGIRMFVARPVLGVGSGAFRDANASGNYGPATDMQAHSLYIELFATMGLVGAIVWFWWLGTMLRNLTRARPPTHPLPRPPTRPLPIAPAPGPRPPRRRNPPPAPPPHR